MTNVWAGAAYGLWGALITIYGLLAGTVVNNLGVAACLRMGFVLTLLARIALFLTNSTGVLYACLFVGLPLSGCLGMPVLTVSMRQYTATQDQGFAFGLSQCSHIFVATSQQQCQVEIILIL
jgi:hypothetical protein